MIIVEHIQSRKFSFNAETKNLAIDEMSESGFTIDSNDIKTLMNMFKFISDNKML